MSPDTEISPAGAADVLDVYFLEVRASLLSVAATLDRVNRASGSRAIQADSRMEFIRQSLKILESDSSHKAKDLLELYSLA